ncbi:MAG: CBS domain-containing protein [Desulfobacterales bacterium]|nr:CBS domain-containing protein [Desulfobacterales bacterium]
MKTAAEIMTSVPITLTPETEVTQAARLLLDKGINGVPVVDDAGNLVGILCQSDLIAQQKKLPIPSLFTFLDGLIPLTSMKQVERAVKKIAAVTVADAMTANPVTVKPDTSIETVAALMVDNSFHTVPVVDGGRIVGVIGKADILKTLVS